MKTPLAATMEFDDRFIIEQGAAQRSVPRDAVLGSQYHYADRKAWVKNPYPMMRSNAVSAIRGEPAGPYSSIYWLTVVKAEGLFPRPLGKYYGYVSTDHAAGGIAMCYGPTPKGPWTFYGQVYIDAAGGGDSETPQIWPDPNNPGTAYLFYHNSSVPGAIGAQSTLCATTTDGITFTKVSTFILDLLGTNAESGDGHTGYVSMFEGDSGIHAYGLYGGAGTARFVLWNIQRSMTNWISDRKSLGYALHLTQGAPLNGRYPSWNTSVVVRNRKGQRYWVGRMTDFVSGATPTNSLIAVAPISSDYRQLLGRPVVIEDPTLPWQSTNLRSLTSYLDRDTNILYLYPCYPGYIGVIENAL